MQPEELPHRITNHEVGDDIFGPITLELSKSDYHDIERALKLAQIFDRVLELILDGLDK